MIDSAIGGLSRLERVGKATGGWIYRLEGIGVGTGGQLMAKNMSQVELAAEMSLTIMRTSGATSFVAGRASVPVTGVALVVSENSGLTQFCRIHGVSFTTSVTLGME